MSIILLGSTSGSVTLQEPAVAGSTTIDLPATSGTMALTSGVVTSLNGSTGALKGMTLISTTNVTAATTIDITNIPTTAGSTYLMQIQGRTTGSAGTNQFSLRYSTNNGSTFATTSIQTASNNFADGSFSITQYMGDAIFTTYANSNIFTQITITNGGTVNGASVYPYALSAITSGDYENGNLTSGRLVNSPPYDPSVLDASSPMIQGAGTVRGATFNALRIIRRAGSQTFTGNVKLFLLGV